MGDSKVVDINTRKPVEILEGQSEIITVDRDIIVKQTMQHVEVAFKGETANPMNIMASIFVAMNGIKKAFISQYGEVQTSKIVAGAIAVSKGYEPVLRDINKDINKEDDNGIE